MTFAKVSPVLANNLSFKFNATIGPANTMLFTAFGRENRICIAMILPSDTAMISTVRMWRMSTTSQILFPIHSKS